MRLLLLGGTQEARQIAVALRGETRLAMTVSLAHGTRRPQSFAAPVRIGGWGGEEAFRAWLEASGIEAVLDATHPFAHQMAHRAAEVARDMGLQHMRLVRPPWLPGDGDKWAFVNSAADAARQIPEGARVFVAIGRGGLQELQPLRNARVICRAKEQPDTPFPFEDGMYLVDRGPFTVAGEMRVLKDHGITWLVARNSGGRGSWPKLEAARRLGLDVAMIRRPPQPDCTRVSTVAEALAWVRRRL